MSAVAKKMLEKMGWKEGEGLGKDRDGVKSYVKVVRRDPKSAAGLGHIADPNTGHNLNTAHAIELDAVYGEMQKRKAHKRRRATGEEDSSDDDDTDVDDDGVKGGKAARVGKKKRAASSSASSQERTESEANAGSSSSDSDSSDEGEDKRVDVTTLSDTDLFKRCGGVRLGRAGRHRFFSGKLARIDASHGKSSNTNKNASSSSDSE